MFRYYWKNRHFSWTNFLLAMSLSASWQIAFGPYVADYSRYLPTKTPTIKAFLAVGSGTVIGTQASMILGVFAAALAGNKFAGNEVVYCGLGQHRFNRGVLYISIFYGKVTITALNAYGSFMSMAAIWCGFRGKAKFLVAKGCSLLSSLLVLTLLGLAGQHSFLNSSLLSYCFFTCILTP